MDNVWTFEFVDETSQKNLIDNGIVDTIGSGASEKPNKKKEEKGFYDTFSDKIGGDLVKQYAISPLNTITGGFASPMYKTIVSISKSREAGVAMGGLIGVATLTLLSKGMEMLERRIQTIESKVKDLGNTDNALIRAGSVTKTTYYSTSIFGVKKKTNRS